MVQADQADLETPPPVPPHQAAPPLATQISIENQLTDLEQLIQSGELERLDSVVTEFTSQFPPESGENINCSEINQSQPVPQVQS